MKHLMSEEDREFKKKFESCEFPASEFNHRAHLRLAYIYLVENDTETSVDLMRDSLHRYLQHNGVSPSKYHETMTKAWILAVRHFMNKTENSDSSDSLINQHPVMLDSKIMMTHYSAEVLYSDEARKKFIEPDLDPIPKDGK